VGVDRIMGSEVAAGWSRLASRRSVLVLCGLLVGLIVGSVPLAVENHQASISGLPNLLLVVAFGGVGAVVAWHQERNPVGWLLLAVAVFFMVNDVASAYSVFDYRLHGGLPLGSVAVLLQPTWAPAIVCAGLSVLLFPDGRLPSRRLGWPLGLLLAVGGLWQLGAFGIAADAIVRHDIHVDSGGNLLQVNHPHGAWAWWGDVQNVFFPLLGASWLLWLLWQVPRYRRSKGEQRLQLKWLLSGVSIFAVSAVALVGLSSASSGILQALGKVAFVGLFAFPICIGVGILRYRLYEIDRLISRTISYLLVTGLLVGVFVGLVVLTTRVLPFSSPVGVAGSTLAAAALFNPLRLRVQRLVDRRFDRARYDAPAIVAAFSHRLRDTADLDTVRGELLRVVDGTVAPTHTTLWTRPSGSTPHE